jgi:hypothetical protein
MKKQDIQNIIMKYFLSKQKTKQPNFLIYKEGSRTYNNKWTFLKCELIDL